MPSVEFASFARFASKELSKPARQVGSSRSGEFRISGRESRELERMRSRSVWIFFMSRHKKRTSGGDGRRSLYHESMSVDHAGLLAECARLDSPSFERFAS